MAKDELFWSAEEKKMHKDYEEFFNDLIHPYEYAFYDPELAMKSTDITDKLNDIIQWCDEEGKTKTKEPIYKMSADIFEEMFLQERLIRYKMGYLLYVAKHSHYASVVSVYNRCQGLSYEDCPKKTRKVCSQTEWCKTKEIKIHPFERLTPAQKDEYIAYFLYISYGITKGRTINDIKDIDPKLIKIICHLDPQKYNLFQEFENLILKYRKKVGVKVLEKTVMKVNSNNDISIEEAYIQAKAEYETELKQKREQKRQDFFALKEVNKIKEEKESLTKERDYLKNKCDDLEKKCNSMEIRLAELEKRLGIQTDSSGNTDEPDNTETNDDVSIDMENAIATDNDTTKNEESESEGATSITNPIPQILNAEKIVDVAKLIKINDN